MWFFFWLVYGSDIFFCYFVFEFNIYYGGNVVFVDIVSILIKLMKFLVVFNVGNDVDG